MGRFSRKMKKELGKESVNTILNSGRSIQETKRAVRRARLAASKAEFVNNNIHRIPQEYSQELLNMVDQKVDSNVKVIKNKEEG